MRLYIFLTSTMFQKIAAQLRLESVLQDKGSERERVRESLRFTKLIAEFRPKKQKEWVLGGNST